MMAGFDIAKTARERGRVLLYQFSLLVQCTSSFRGQLIN